MATSAELREQVQQFQLQITHFGHPLSTLSAKIAALATSSTEESSAQIRAALETTKSLLSFIHATPIAATPRINGELLSHLAQLFGLFAVAEGVSAALATDCDPLIRELDEFEEENGIPMSDVLEQLKEHAQKSINHLAERVKELKSQKLSVENEAESKLEKKKEMEAQLTELTESVAQMYRQVESLGVEKTALEQKALRLKRRKSHGGQMANSFFAAFAPALVPLAGNSGAVTIVTQDQIHTLTDRIRELQEQISAVASSSLEESIEQCMDEHFRLQGIALAMVVALEELEADQEFINNTCLLLTALDDEMESMRRDRVKIREVVIDLKGRLEADAKKAERCKHELAQTLVAASRMEYGGAKEYVISPIRTALKLLEGIPESGGAQEVLAVLTPEC
ncbi:hypothetical protein EX30DRAFT_368989 [Ascodesmis nigricans]|uniref:Uncharacterized protein n=1 Tax=Ascodesmis nigricans TaxID=341454 RepID=A0A4V3SJE2_9PEZI|nr:hypothetical protein EX30DRAFT_368989 [Ascodesmis nigricans]